ncbi:MAG: nicotinate-nucleotide diphosphorylase (carboxylating), partial [Myxococcota bacterium]
MSSIDWSSLLDHADVQTLIELALREDIGTGDATTRAVFPSPVEVQADVVARSATVVCGLPLIAEIVQRFDPDAIVVDP